jgi:hypothetical protein
MRQDHWRTWNCPFGCQTTYPTTLDFEEHVKKFHHHETATKNLDTLQHLSSYPDVKQAHGRCPLCLDAQITSERHYSSHVADHLESLALFALPSTADEEEGSLHDNEDTEDSGHGSEAGTGVGSLPAEELTMAEVLQSLRGQGELEELVAKLSRTGFFEKAKTALLRSSATESQVAEDLALEAREMYEELGNTWERPIEEWKARKAAEGSLQTAQDHSSGPSSYYSELPQPPQCPASPRPPTIDLNQLGDPEDYIVHSDAYAVDDSAQPGPSLGSSPGRLSDPYPESKSSRTSSPSCQ